MLLSVHLYSRILGPATHFMHTWAFVMGSAWAAFPDLIGPIMLCSSLRHPVFLLPLPPTDSMLDSKLSHEVRDEFAWLLCRLLLRLNMCVMWWLLLLFWLCSCGVCERDPRLMDDCERDTTDEEDPEAAPAGIVVSAIQGVAPFSLFSAPPTTAAVFLLLGSIPVTTPRLPSGVEARLFAPEKYPNRLLALVLLLLVLLLFPWVLLCVLSRLSAPGFWYEAGLVERRSRVEGGQVATAPSAVKEILRGYHQQSCVMSMLRSELTARTHRHRRRQRHRHTMHTHTCTYT